MKYKTIYIIAGVFLLATIAHGFPSRRGIKDQIEIQAAPIYGVNLDGMQVEFHNGDIATMDLIYTMNSEPKAVNAEETQHPQWALCYAYGAEVRCDLYFKLTDLVAAFQGTDPETFLFVYPLGIPLAVQYNGRVMVRGAHPNREAHVIYDWTINTD